jgi:Domain of unknown function (DUF6460)
MELFFGGNPLAVIVKLVVICIITGLVLNTVGIDPKELLQRFPEVLRAISEFGWSWVERALNWFALGAIIVVPVWVIIRLLKLVAGDSGRPSRS